MIFLFVLTVEGAETLDKSCVMWAWLLDMERTCALLIGRCLGGMLIGNQLSNEERQAEPWLSSDLFSNGLQMCAKDTGDSYYVVMRVHLRHHWIPCIIN